METFEKLAPGKVRSSEGFCVEWVEYGCLVYSEGTVAFDIDFEMFRDEGLVLYGSKLRRADDANGDRILSNAARALRFLGYIVEVEPRDGGAWSGVAPHPADTVPKTGQEFLGLFRKHGSNEIVLWATAWSADRQNFETTFGKEIEPAWELVKWGGVVPPR
jgi:hypothetical protein